MREIIVRAWNPLKMTMSAPYEPLGNGYLNGTRPKFWPKNMVFMLDTGYKDKNGKRIFDGDILNGNREVKLGEYFGPFGIGTGFYTICFKAEYDNAKAFEGDPFGMTSRQADGSEVIGNIYSNPELLK